MSESDNIEDKVLFVNRIKSINTSSTVIIGPLTIKVFSIGRKLATILGDNQSTNHSWQEQKL